MNRLMIGIVSMVICIPLLVAATMVYYKKTSEFEQLVLGKLTQYLLSEEKVVSVAEFQIDKPSLFSGYNEWIISHEITKEQYQYIDGTIVKIGD